MGYTRPDIYIEEILSPEQAPQGVSTSIGAFVGATARGPVDRPILITAFADFTRIFGGPVENENLYYSVRSFFQNGGVSCYVVRMYAVASAPVSANFTFDNEATSVDLLKVSAGYRGDDSFGVAGKTLTVRMALSGRVDASVSTDAQVGDLEAHVSSINGMVSGAILKINENGADNYVVVRDTYSKLDSGILKHYVTFTEALTATLTALGSTIISLEYDLTVHDTDDLEIERWDTVSMNPDADNYVETLVNDTEIGSSYIKVEDLLPTGAMSAKEVEINELAPNSFWPLTNNGNDELTGLVLADITGNSDGRGIDSLSPKKANLLMIPPSDSAGKITTAMLPNLQMGMLEFCGNRMDMFAILDTPAGLTGKATGAGSVGDYRAGSLGVDSYWGAMYFPHIKVKKPNSTVTKTIPCSGAVAGLYSRVDGMSPPLGGISSSPAGHGESGLIKGVVGVGSEISDADHGSLNVMGINCLRLMARANGALSGVLTLGARTLSSKEDFTYINVRRMMTFIEDNAKNIAKPYLFKNNGPVIWGELTNLLESFLSSLGGTGQLAGSSDAESFYVKIDGTNNSSSDMRQGIMNAEVGVALLRPAEFIIFKFSQSQTGGTSVEE